MYYSDFRLYATIPFAIMFANLTIPWMELFSSLEPLGTILTSRDFRQYLLTSSTALVYLNYFLNKLSYKQIFRLTVLHSVLTIIILCFSLVLENKLLLIITIQFLLTVTHMLDNHISDALLDAEKEGHEFSLRTNGATFRILHVTGGFLLLTLLPIMADFNNFELVNYTAIAIHISILIELYLISKFVKLLPKT